MKYTLGPVFVDQKWTRSSFRSAKSGPVLFSAQQKADPIFRRQELDRPVHFLPRTNYRVTVHLQLSLPVGSPGFLFCSLPRVLIFPYLCLLNAMPPQIVVWLQLELYRTLLNSIPYIYRTLLNSIPYIYRTLLNSIP